jgi:hypothetical protein
MKAFSRYSASLLILLCAALGVQAVPAPTTLRIDLNDDGNIELSYETVVIPVQQFPPIWQVGGGVHPSSDAKFLRANGNRFDFRSGESIGANTTVFVIPYDDGPEYGFVTLSYFEDHTRPDIYRDGGGLSFFADVSSFLLGVRLVGEEGTHYGWVKFSRPVVDNHTLFEIVGHDWNPIPGAAIPAGEPPGPPPVQAGVTGDGQLNFNWDQRAGAMVLEWADRLDASGVWQPVPDSGFPPVSLPAGEGNRFFRLRRP